MLVGSYKINTNLIISIFRAFLILWALPISSCNPNPNIENALESDHSNQNTIEECGTCSDKFWIKKFTHTHIDGSVINFNLTADSLVERIRKGRIIEFSNYDELYIKKLSINQSLSSKLVQFDNEEINSLIPSNRKLIEDEGGDENNTTNINTSDTSKPEILGNRLNRILVDDFSVTFKPTNVKKPPILLKSDHAKILTSTMLMQFQGNVKVQATKCKLSANEGIWSSPNNGIFLLGPYKLNNKIYKSSDFFQITNLGECKKIHSINHVEYVDELDLIENKIIALMPIPVQFLFGFLTFPRPPQ